MLVGIVGKPSSGKSSFLNALTDSDIAKVGNYPFTTLKPNVGVGYAFKDCVCSNMGVNCGQCVKNLRPIPIKVIDVAGLVPGASEGKGMGNQFLSDLSQADILFHIVDSSGSLNEEGEDVENGSHNPLYDIKFLENEIDAWIFSILMKDWEKISRTARSNKTPIVDIFTNRLSGLKITKGMIKKAMSSNLTLFSSKIENWNEDVFLQFSKKIRKSSKPITIVLNKIDKKTSLGHYENVKAELGEDKLIVSSALAEIVLQSFSKQGKIEYFPLEGLFNIKSVNEKEKSSLNQINSQILKKFNSTGIPNILLSAIEKLEYITVYPVADTSHLTDQNGKVLPDVHLVPKGTTAKDLARKIHQDLFDSFLCGIDARTNKRLSDDYILKENDIIKIMSSK